MNYLIHFVKTLGIWFAGCILLGILENLASPDIQWLAIINITWFVWLVMAVIAACSPSRPRPPEHGVPSDETS